MLHISVHYAILCYTFECKGFHTLVLYVSVHYAIYLETWSRKEVIEKIATLFSIQSSQITEVFICDKKTASFLVILTDDVVQNMVDESQYLIEGQQSKPFTITCSLCHSAF